MPFPPSFCVLFGDFHAYSAVVLKLQTTPAPLRVPNYWSSKINLVADYSPGGSPAGTPLLGPCGPRSPLGRGVGYPPRVTVGI